MTNKEYGKIIGKNLRRIIYEKGKTPTEVANDLKINRSTLSCWMSGTRTPKMESIDRLCSYLGVIRDDLMEPEHTEAELKKAKFESLVRQLTEDDVSELIKYMEFLISKH